MSSRVVMESSGGHICHPIVDAGDGVGDKWGRFVYVYMHGQGLCEAPSYGGSDVLSLFVQLMVGVLLHQVATWMCWRVARCSNMR